MHLLVGWDALVQSVSQNVLASQEPANASKCVKTLTLIEFECIQAMVNWSTVVSPISENGINWRSTTPYQLLNAPVCCLYLIGCKEEGGDN